MAYAIRVPANESLEWAIADLLVRPPGRPSRTPLVRYKSFSYQAGTWTQPRRIVAKVEHHAGELFPRVGFIETNLRLPSRAVMRFYNRRGTAEPWIKEGKQAAHSTRLSLGNLKNVPRECTSRTEEFGCRVGCVGRPKRKSRFTCP